MSNNEKKVQTKDNRNIPFPKNIQKEKASRISANKNNKNTINKVISRNKNEAPFLKYNDEIKTTNKLPPKAKKTHIRGNSAELRRIDKKAHFNLIKAKK